MAGATCALAGCDEPLLSADFSGPPADTVEGTVTPGPGGSASGSQDPALEEPHRPRMSLEWLAGGLDSMATAPIGQTVSFRRSGSLGQDRVEISLSNPRPEARFRLGETEASVAVGKIFYYDDRNENAELDWDCAGVCDVVRSRSQQFVVFVDEPPTCAGFGTSEVRFPSTAQRPTRGYHYFSYDGDAIVEDERDAGLDLELVNMSPAEANPALELARFSNALAASWLATRAGCF